MIGQMYYSREDRVSELTPENERVQWQDLSEDAKRVDEVKETFDELTDGLYDTLAAYSETLTEDLGDDEVQQAATAYARREVIEAWALAQASISKVAHVLRFNGNDAFQRMVEALKTGEAVDMRGL